jgi:hypothetical protein
MAKDGIAIVCDDDNKLVGDQQNMVSPRVGLTYQFTPKWVVRSGIGKFYQTSSTANILRTVTGNYPFSYNVSLSPNNTTSTPIFFADGSHATFTTGISKINVGDPTNFNAAGLGMEGIPSPRVYPYTVQYNVSVQRELTSTSSISIAYVGSRGFDGGLTYNYNAPRDAPAEHEPNPVPDSHLLRTRWDRLGYGAKSKTTPCKLRFRSD